MPQIRALAVLCQPSMQAASPTQNPINNTSRLQCDQTMPQIVWFSSGWQWHAMAMQDPLVHLGPLPRDTPGPQDHGHPHACLPGREDHRANACIIMLPRHKGLAQGIKFKRTHQSGQLIASWGHGNMSRMTPRIDLSAAVPCRSA